MVATALPSPIERQRPYAVLSIVAFGVFIAALDLTVVSTMLPQMIVDFEIPIPAGLDDAAWIVSAYLIAYTVAMPFMGRVSDLYGRRRTFVAGLVLFALSSLAVPLAPNLPWLIAGRAAQALGGGALVPVAMAAVGDVFPAQRRAFAIGLLGAVDTVGWISGPIYGGLLVRYGPELGSWLAGRWAVAAPVAGWGWQWVFYLNLPLSILAIAAAWWGLRESAPVSDRARRSLDWTGIVLLSAGLIALNVGLSLSGGQASLSPSFDFSQTGSSGLERGLPWLIGGGLALVCFVWAESRASGSLANGLNPSRHARPAWPGRMLAALSKRPVYPLIDLTMFRQRNFALACLLNLVIGLALIVAMVDVPLFVNAVVVQDQSLDALVREAALQSGQILTALTVAMSLASVIGGWLCGRFGYRLPALAGQLMTATAFFLMSRWGPGQQPLPMAIHLALAGLGFGLVTAPVATATIDAVGPELRGIAAGLVLILRLMGMSIGLSALTAWGLSRFDVLSAAYSVTDLNADVVSEITARVLGETFLAAACLTLLGVIAAAGLRRRAEV